MKMIVVSGVLIEDLRRYGGYYICPKNSQGERLGPLVGYAGKYEAPDGSKKAFVGDVYYNFAKMEVYPDIYGYYASNLANKVSDFPERKCDIVLGAPMGGIILASDMARFLNCRRIFAEKKVISAATNDKREESILVIDRHDINFGDRVILAEDICNNFSTTEKLIELVEKNAGQITAIACLLNRSGKRDYLHRGITVPVISSLYLPTLQYKQEDPKVVYDMEAGNVVWKPKNEWVRLEKAMNDAELNEAAN